MPRFPLARRTCRRAVRHGNIVALALVFVVSTGLMLSHQQVARAQYDGPCPQVVDYTTACPAGQSSDWLWSGTDCAQCDPFWANGQKHYRCAYYDRYNVYCQYEVDGQWMANYVGIVEFLIGDSGLGSASCVNGTCLAN